MAHLYLLLADLVFLIHLGFILFILFGGASFRRWPWMLWLHLPAMVWGILILWLRWVCPLTPLENWLLTQAGESPYAGGFIAQYLRPVIYTEGTEISWQLAWGLVALGLLGNGWFYIQRLRPHK